MMRMTMVTILTHCEDDDQGSPLSHRLSYDHDHYDCDDDDVEPLALPPLNVHYKTMTMTMTMTMTRNPLPWARIACQQASGRN